MKFTFYIGVEYDRAGKMVDPRQRAAGMEKPRLLAVEKFGGYTLTMCEGADSSGRVEGTVKLETFGLDDTVAADFGREAGRLFSQATVLLSVHYDGAWLVPVPVNDPRHVPGIVHAGPMEPLPAPVPLLSRGD